MIKHLTNDLIDREQWDACINRAVNGYVYAYSWYLDIVCPGWEALVEDDYSAVFPLPSALKYGIAYCIQPYFTQQLGLFSVAPLSSGVVESFIQAIPAKFKYIDLNFNTLNNIKDERRLVIPMADYELDLIAEYEKIAAAFSSNLSRNLKKAAKCCLTLVKNVKPDDVVHLFRNNRGQRLSHLGNKQYFLLTRLIYACIYKGIGEVWGTYDEHNQLCAGVVWLRSNNRIIFLFSGLSQQGRQCGAMPFLIDSMIRQHAGTPVILDFEGSNDEDLARFYAGFGSKRVTYHRIIMNRLSVFGQIGLRFVRSLRKLR